MNSPKENLLGLNERYQDQVRECNIKYDKLVKEYKTNHPSKNSNFWTRILVYLLLLSCISISFWSCLSCCACDLDKDIGTIIAEGFENGFEMWFEISGEKALIVAGIVFLLCVCEKIVSKTKNSRIENAVNALEHERKKELSKLQEKYEHDRRQIIMQYSQNNLNN